jgi:hypothetical protein
MVKRALLGWIVCLCWLALPAWAVEYRLQVTNIERLTFTAYIDRSDLGGTGSMRRLESRLDRMEFPTAAVLPGREVRFLEDPHYGGIIPSRLAVLPATREQAWTTLVWEANPGDKLAFVVRSDMAAWQEVWAVAANPNGVLRSLSIGGPGLFGGQRREVPIVSINFLANAVDRGTYATWLQEAAPAVDGMAFVVGRRNEVFTTGDRVYMLLTMPPEPRTFKVVIGWRDHDDRGTNGRIFERMRWRP